MGRRCQECEECEWCGARARVLCEDCGCCGECCECDLDLFDADELGLDPENDEVRRYGRREG